MGKSIGRSVPPICISKPGSAACQLLKYDCHGNYAGYMELKTDDIEACRAFAAEQKDCKITMRFKQEATAQFIIENYDDCTVPPVHAFEWNFASAELDYDEPDQAQYAFSKDGMYEIFLGDGTPLGLCNNGILVYYTLDKINNTWQTTLFIDPFFGPFYEWPGQAEGYGLSPA